MRIQDFLKYAKEINESSREDYANNLLRGVIGNQDYRRWFNNNYDWLVEWLQDPIYPMGDIDVRAVIKKNDEEIIKTNIMQIFYKAIDSGQNDQDAISLMKREMVVDMLRSMVFGIKMNGTDDTGWGQRLMSGFIEQKGRLPRPDDRVRVYFFAVNGIERWFSVHKGPLSTVVVTECAIIAE